MNEQMCVREAAQEQIASCELSDGRLAVFAPDNNQTYIRGYAVEVER